VTTSALEATATASSKGMSVHEEEKKEYKQKK
jgi:hypothetical protein